LKKNTLLLHHKIAHIGTKYVSGKAVFVHLYIKLL
jgi:hypothetical protein